MFFADNFKLATKEILKNISLAKHSPEEHSAFLSYVLEIFVNNLFPEYVLKICHLSAI
jgi:hypothetical protein